MRAFRPGHFDGVATVVAKLFTQARAPAAYFGEKDWQQLQIVRRMARDLDLGVVVHGVPTMREADGLARSSRNRYLTSTDRQQAALLPQTLKTLSQHISVANAASLLARARTDLEAAGFKLDYLEWADANTCGPVTPQTTASRVFAAAYVGRTRLIDNWPVSR